MTDDSAVKGSPSTNSNECVDEWGINDAREDSNGGSRPACFKSTFQEVLFVATTTMAIAMGSWLSGSIVVISSFVARELHTNQAGITWLAASSSLTSGAFLLFFGRVADLFGRKTLFIGSLLLYSVFCLAAGFVDSGIALDVINGVIGIFTAAAVPAAIGILSIAYGPPSKRKTAAFACFSGGNPLGFVFGTIFGGLATTLLGWRANFWFIAIVFSIFTLISFFVVPKDDTEKRPFNWETIKHFDIVGTVLTVGGIGMFCAALSLGDTAPNGWRTNYVLVLLILGFLMIIGFVVWETYSPDPIVPMGIWKDRNFTIGLVVLMLGFMAFIPASFFISLLFQEVWRMSSLMVAVHLLPMAVSGVIVNIVAAKLMHRVSNKLLLFIGSLAYSVACLLLAMNRETSSYWSFCFPALTIMVIGADLEFNVMNMYVISTMSPSEGSVAGGIVQTGSKLSMALGLGISTAVFSAVQMNPGMSSYWGPAVQPYAAVFWFSFIAASVGVCLVPFMSIGTQGAPSDGEKKAAELEQEHD